MKLTILGGGAAWPTARQACGGYLVEHGDTSLLIDPGYATLPRLLAMRDVADIDAVLISHGHLDHCADLNPLLRARVMCRRNLEPLPVYAPKRALDRVLDAERIRTVARGAEVSALADGDTLTFGPIRVEIGLLPHHMPNAGMRLSAGDEVIAYTGDSGDCEERITLAKGADLLLAEATYATEIPPGEAAYLSSAQQVARMALAADARSTILTHGWPNQATERLLAATRIEGLSGARVAFGGMNVDLSHPNKWAPVVGTFNAVAVGMHQPGRPPLVRGRRAADGVVQAGTVAVLPRRAAVSS